MKVQYYRFLVTYHVHEKQTLEAAKGYQIIFDTLVANADLFIDERDRIVAFQNFIIFLMLSPYNNEKIDLLNIVQAKYARELEIDADTQGLAKFLTRFLSNELLPFEAAQVETQVKGFDPFNSGVTEHADLHLQEFLRQLIQHNIRTI
jgi:hypothetical protein